MCGRYGLYDADDLEERFGLPSKPGFVSRDNFNVSPHQRVPGIYLLDGVRVAELMQWGFVPDWVKDPSKSKYSPINTVAETAFEKSMWKNAVKHRRCLIPARGFFEWKKYYDEEGHITHKEKYYIHPRGIDLYAFAGIYSVKYDVEGVALFTFSIMTTAPNEQMAEVHDRMPVMLLPEQETLWLDPAYSEQEQLADLLVPYEGELEIYRVSDDKDLLRANDKRLIEPLPK